MGIPQNCPLSVRRFPSRLLPAFALLAIIIGFAPYISAQDGSAQPARAVRLSYVDGKVQLSQGNQPIADQAAINTPLLQGMTLTTAEDGKAEVQFEDGSVARIAPNSTLELSTLTGVGTTGDADVTLQRGEGYFEFQGTGQVGNIRIHFGDSTVSATSFAVFRVQYDAPPGALAVFTGQAHLERGRNIFLDVQGGQSLTFNTNSASSYDLTESIPSDSWDAWNSDRDQALNAELATQTPATSDLSQNDSSSAAWNDLNSSGSWYNVPGQGYVWSPYEAANASFDPYGYGRWVYLPPYGYTWASSYSWGYLPYSCGVWNYYDTFGWGWAPGFGGCSPWWRTGFYVGISIGFAPGWYRPIHRPEPPRAHPWPNHPFPIIAVRRNEPGMGGPLPPRDRNTPVNIGGATVVGLRPFPGGISSPRSGPVIRGATGITQGGGFSNRPVFIAPRNSYGQPVIGGVPVRPGTPGAIIPGRRPGVYPGAQQPGSNYSPLGSRVFPGPTSGSPTGNRVFPGPDPGSAVPYGATGMPPVQSPRPYSPVPPPTIGSPIRPGSTTGGWYHPAPAPVPGGSYGPGMAPNPAGGGVIRSGPAPGGGGMRGVGPAPGGGGMRGGAPAPGGGPRGGPGPGGRR